MQERAFVFPCGTDRLVAIVSHSSRVSTRGVLVVVGGPQYRAGSHRQFTLLCRALAERDVTAMRYDYRGMGDSTGEARNFEHISGDIGAAVDHFCQAFPEVREIVIWGLCDAASAACLYAHGDPRVTGMILLNPWVRTAESLAKAQIKHYYWSRITERAFWQKIMRGEFEFTNASRSFAQALFGVLGLRKSDSADNANNTSRGSADQSTTPLPERMLAGLERFQGKLLFILSGNDLTAREFEEVVNGSRQWHRLISRESVLVRKLPAATHTFSSQPWRDQIANWTIDWVKSW